MAKLSIYIADELWTRAKALDPGEGDSKVIQRALEDRVQRAEARPYAVLSEDNRDAQEKIAARVATRLAEAYQAGFAAGLRFAGDLTWDSLSALAGVHFDPPQMRRLMTEHDLDAVDEAGNAYVLDWEQFFFEEGFSSVVALGPTGVFLEGFVDACRSVWEAAGGPALVSTATTITSPSPRPIDAESEVASRPDQTDSSESSTKEGGTHD